MMKNIDRQPQMPVQQLIARPWKRALVWLLFLGPFFFISYGFANWLASQYTEVRHIVFAWEQSIPFIPWTIIPYWVIDGLYVISLFICATKTQLDSHARRLLTAQTIAVFCFIVIPMGFSFERPEVQGFTGELFIALSYFDQPYNQAPSLHIALLVILWALFVKHIPNKFILLFHCLCALIAISVLTTYQHHFIDVPTGALLGLFCVWLWPEDGQKMIDLKNITVTKSSLRLGFYYLVAASVLSILALFWGDTALWLLWPAFSLFLVAIIYLLTGEKGFQKNAQGRMSLAAKCLLLPYLIGAKLNSRIWTRNISPADYIVEGVSLGRFPNSVEIRQNKYSGIIDMTAEFIAPNHQQNWKCIPSLDLLSLEKDKILQATTMIEENISRGPVLVCCALGYSRSAIVVIAWLLVTGRAKSVDTAMQLVRAKRPSIVIGKADRQKLEVLMTEASES